MRRLFSPFAILPFLFPIASAFGGVITTYTDRPTFNSAVSGSLTVEDFTPTDHFPITTGVLNSSTNLPGIGITPGLIKPGVTYSTPIGSGNFFNIDFGGAYSGGFLDGFEPSTRVLTIVFDSSVAAFGFDIGGLGAQTFDVDISFDSGPDQIFTNAYPGTVSFFGFQSSLTDIKSVVVGNHGGFFGFDLDNFTFGGSAAKAAPEPSALLLFGIGLMGLLGRGLRTAGRAA